MRGKQLTATKMRNIFPSFLGVHGAVHSVHCAVGVHGAVVVYRAIHSVQVYVRILFV